MSVKALAPVELQCVTCNEEKGPGDFPVKRDRKRGTERRLTRCIPCERDRVRAAMRARRRQVTSGYAGEVLRYGRKEADRRGWKRRGRGIARAMRAWGRHVRRMAPPRVRTEEERRAYWRSYQRHRRRHHRQRMAARRAVQRAVENGTLTKPSECQRCSEVTPRRSLHGHHYLGYQPIHRLRVRWLCVGCHAVEEGGWARGLER